MRILIANDSSRDAGGVHTYLESVMSPLLERGHELAFFQIGNQPPMDLGAGVTIPYFSIERDGSDRALEQAAAWAPQVIFSNQLALPTVDRRLFPLAPVVKIAHGHYGTCISGHKMHLWPRAVPCDRVFGPACVALYLPRHCGQHNVPKMLHQIRAARQQNALLEDYATMIVTSGYMRQQYLRHGLPEERITVNPLFPGVEGPLEPPAMTSPEREAILFLGRMTELKGGNVLVRAVADASRRLGRRIPLVMAGDGPSRAGWTALAAELGVDATFPGWVHGEERTRLLAAATLIAVPSVWAEPFGLVGLEANLFGVPALAFDVGGIGEWLKDGVNGRLVRGSTPDSATLAATLVEMLGDRAALDRMRRGAVTTAAALSVERHVDVLEATLARAAQSRPPSASRDPRTSP